MFTFFDKLCVKAEDRNIKSLLKIPRIKKGDKTCDFKAQFNAKKKYGEDEVVVTMYLPHTGHIKSSYQTWARQQMLSISQEYPKKLVESGATHAQFNATIRGKIPSDLNTEAMKGSVPVLAPKVLRIKPKDFYNRERS